MPTHRHLPTSHKIHLPVGEFEIPPGLLQISEYPTWLGGPVSVELTNTQFRKGTKPIFRHALRNAREAEIWVADLLAQIDVLWVDIRDKLWRDAAPIMRLLAKSPSREELIAALSTEDSLKAGQFLLARSLGHTEGTISRIEWTHLLPRRPDCWDLRITSVEAETNSNVGTPMHRYGGNPFCSESVLPMWAAGAPTDPATAVAEAMLYDAGISGILYGYSWIKTNKERRAQMAGLGAEPVPEVRTQMKLEGCTEAQTHLEPDEFRF